MFSGVYLCSRGTGEFINQTGLHDFNMIYNDLPDKFSYSETNGKISKITYIGEEDVMVFGITRARCVRYRSSDTWNTIGTFLVNSEGQSAIGIATTSFQQDWGYTFEIPYIVKLSKGDQLLLIATNDYVKTEGGGSAWLTIIKTFD